MKNTILNYSCDICNMRSADIKNGNYYFCQICYEERNEEIKEARNHKCFECGKPAFIKVSVGEWDDEANVTIHLGYDWLCKECWFWWQEHKYDE